MKNSKKFTPFTFLAICFGIFLAITDDYIVEYLGAYPSLGILLVAVLAFSFFIMTKKNEVKESKF